MKSSQPTQIEIIAKREQGMYWLHLLLALVVAESVVILATNTPRTVAVFLFLFILLAGLSLELGRMRALLVWLVVTSLWIAAKHFLGAWSQDLLIYHLLEVLLLLAVAWTAGVYSDRQRRDWNSFAELELRLRAMDLEDRGAGLLRSAPGLLRLEEEQERAFQCKRPLSLLLLEVQPIPGAPWEPRQGGLVMKAVAAALKDIALETDVPFQVSNERMALILPETGMDSLQTSLDRLIANLQVVRSVQENGETRLVSDQAQVRYGFSVYLGESSAAPDMMTAAVRSLERSIEANNGPIFQNLFVEHELLGHMPELNRSVLNVMSE